MTITEHNQWAYGTAALLTAAATTALDGHHIKES